jgi:hypothetical protein
MGRLAAHRGGQASVSIDGYLGLMVEVSIDRIDTYYQRY